jgi:hypothetical protein
MEGENKEEKGKDSRQGQKKERTHDRVRKRKGLTTGSENRNAQPGAQKREVEKSQVFEHAPVARRMSKKERGGKHELVDLHTC